MDRPRAPRPPRHRRRDPLRTGPIRNSGELLRDGDPRRAPARSFDAASRGVSEGYRVIDEQIRRGRQTAQALDDDENRNDRSRGERRRWPRDERDERDDWRRDERRGYNLLALPMRQIERLTREILRQIASARPDPWRLAELIFRLQLEAFSELARFGIGALGGFSPRREDPFDEDVERIDRDIDERYEEIQEELDYEEDEDDEDEPWLWSPAPSTPTTIRSTVPIPILVSSHERTEIDLDLPAGSQSLDLAIEPPMAVGAGEVPHPAFEAELIVLADGPPILRIEVPRDLPAGRYLRRVLIAATGEVVGGLTVQVGTASKPGPKPRPKPKASPRTRKP